MNTNKTSKSVTTALLLVAVSYFAWICCMLAVQPAHADMGPKPSVVVTIENLDGRVCYGTLLSYYETTGPNTAYSPDYPYIPSRFDPESEYCDEEEYAIWKTFVDYADPDGYYYLQTHWKCHEAGKISWTYYPPNKFKILLYFPETQTFVSSGVCERYAFHSYFAASLSSIDLTISKSDALTVRKNYDYTWEIVSLIVRIVVTVLIELGVAWLFGLRTKKKILSVVLVNVVTQAAMNIALNILAFYRNIWAMLWYIPIELAVFAVEAVAYAIIFSRTQTKTVGTNDNVITNPDHISIGKCVLLSLAANLASFAAGFALILFVPGIF